MVDAVISSAISRNAPLRALRAALETVAPGRVRTNVALADLGRWRIGGPADILVEPAACEEVRDVARILGAGDVPWIVIGEGSNLLFDSAGFRGVVVRIGSAMSRFRGDARTGLVEAEAGIWIPHFVLRTIRLGLSGCVHAVGIPGMLGGLVTMNGGSQRRGIGEHLLNVTLVDRDGQIRTLDRSACAFGYRSSALQEGGAIVVGARFRLEPADMSALRREALAIMAERRRKFPRDLPNCGSVFVSDPALYATLGPPGKAIETTGLKGRRCGGARISPLHANFIVNEGGASSDDVLRLIGMARAAVRRASGVSMAAEVMHLPPDGDLRAAHLSAARLGYEV